MALGTSTMVPKTPFDHDQAFRTFQQESALNGSRERVVTGEDAGRGGRPSRGKRDANAIRFSGSSEPLTPQCCGVAAIAYRPQERRLVMSKYILSAGLILASLTSLVSAAPTSEERGSANFMSAAMLAQLEYRPGDAVWLLNLNAPSAAATIVKWSGSEDIYLVQIGSNPTALVYYRASSMRPRF